MPLYVKDPKVTKLLEEYQAITGADTKTKALLRALERQIAVERKAVPLAERIAHIQDSVKALGTTDPNYHHKRFMDEQWGDS